MPATPSEEVARAQSFDAGVAALDLGNFELAASHLAPVAAICPVDDAGRRAMLMLAAGELDPRNPNRRPDAAAELAAFQMARPTAADAWTAVLAAELYALALDYGATAIAADDLPDAGIVWSRYLPDPQPAGAARAPLGADSAQADAQRRPDAPQTVPVAAAPRASGPRCDVPEPIDELVMPTLTRTPVVNRTQPSGGGQQQPVRADGEDVRALMAENDRLRGELARKEQELDRIRRTLRP